MTQDERRGPRIGRRAALAGAAGLAVAGKARAATPRKGGTLRVAYWTTPTTMDPMTGRGGSDHIFLYPACETLVDFEPKAMTPRPGLAKSWSFPDSKTIVLELQPGVTFHDDTPFDAEAVKFNLERAAGDKRSNVRTDFNSVASVDVTGPLQVTLRLNHPDSSMLLTLSDRAGMMISPTAAKELGVNADRKVVGTGAMRFVSLADNDSLVYTRNEKYWNIGESHLDGIVFKTIPDISTCLRSVIAGENDFTLELSPEQKPLLDRARNVKTVITPSFRLHTVYLNYGRKPLSDVRVRQALNYGIDRAALNKAIGLGLNQETTTELPTEHWACDPTAAHGYPYNPDKARQLLADAGYANGCDITFLGWTELRWQKVQEVMMDQLKRAGFNLHISLGSSGDTSTRFFGPTKEGDGRIAIWSGRPDPTQIYRQLFGKGGFYNAGDVETPGLEELLVETAGVDDLKARTALFSKLQHSVLDNALMLPMMFEALISAFNTKVQNYQPNLLGKPKLQTIWLDA